MLGIELQKRNYVIKIGQSMALHQHHQDMEVIRRRRPELPKPSEIPDIEHYCEVCQRAYRIGWQALLVIVECMQAKNMLMHNIDISITHK